MFSPGLDFLTASAVCAMKKPCSVLSKPVRNRTILLQRSTARRAPGRNPVS
jgi:hypothetical protein